MRRASKTKRRVPEKFLVAFSFAGQERDLVTEIAAEVERRLGVSSVFLDLWYEFYTGGHDGDLKLKKIYDDCEMVVLGVSQGYGEKSWTLMEHEGIRARVMSLRTSHEPGAVQRVFPIRVGEGDVPGIPRNVIAPDVRNRPVADSADMIIERLRLIVPAVAADAVEEEQQTWPAEAVPFNHGLADRTVNEWPSVLQLLTAGSAKRILMFHGPSGYSKSALLIAAEKYTKSLKIPTAYVDFNVTLLLHEAEVLRQIQTGLGKAVPGFAADKEPDRWKLRKALQALREPALILLDTYEKVADTKDLSEWIERQLLAEIDDYPLLRFIIGGQKVPDLAQARWRDRGQSIKLSPILDKKIWNEWAQRLDPTVDEKIVDALVKGYQGVPASISSTLTVVIEGMKSP